MAFDFETYKTSEQYRKRWIVSLEGYSTKGDPAYKLRGGLIVRHNSDGTFTWIR